MLFPLIAAACLLLAPASMGQSASVKRALCPQVLAYDTISPLGSRYTANILLRTSVVLRGFSVHIRFDAPVSLMGNSVGTVETTDNRHFVVKTRKKLDPGPPFSLPIFVRHSEGRVPYIESIKLNSDEICPEAVALGSLAALDETKVYQTLPKRVLVRPGGSVSLLGRTAGPLSFCEFYHAPNYQKIDLSRGPLSTATRDYEYFGAGLDQGECGITLKNIHDGMDGVIESKIKLEDKPEWENCATTLRVTTVAKERLPVFDISPRRANLKTGQNLTISCNTDRSINMCHIYLPGGVYLNLDKGAQSVVGSQYDYHGSGLHAGQCGATISNVSEGLNGFIVCKLGNWPEQTNGAWETDSMKVTTVFDDGNRDDNWVVDATSTSSSEYDIDPRTNSRTTQSPRTTPTRRTTEDSWTTPTRRTTEDSWTTPSRRTTEDSWTTPNRRTTEDSWTSQRSDSDSKESHSVECGKSAVTPVALVTRGQTTQKGQWPWHAAVYTSEGNGDLTYKCGATLIGPRAVVTAAHCVVRQPFDRPVDAATVKVILGKHHLKEWAGNGVQNQGVERVAVHPSYNKTGFHNDIAVLTFVTAVQFTQFVRPICLWDRKNTDITEVEGSHGTVVGWGVDEDGELKDTLTMATMPVVSYQTCVYSKAAHFLPLLRNSTYCAGHANGTSVCNGDSGGGMIFPTRQRDRSNKWFLRGIVSNSVPKTLAHVPGLVCDPYQYVVFTDAAQYLDWLSGFAEMGG